jgi:predicted nucleic acid-binding protein
MEDRPPGGVPSEHIFELSFDSRSRFSLSHWDSMLLAACKEARVTTLYSEDMAAGTNYDGVTIVNPLFEALSACNTVHAGWTG